jgi:hypothetical protein
MQGHPTDPPPVLRLRRRTHYSVFAGLDPVIHAPQAQAVLVLVDARPKAGQGD